MFAAESRGEMPKGTARRWAHHTKSIKRLPAHVKKSADQLVAAAYQQTMASLPIIDRLAIMVAGEKLAADDRSIGEDIRDVGIVGAGGFGAKRLLENAMEKGLGSQKVYYGIGSPSVKGVMKGGIPAGEFMTTARGHMDLPAFWGENWPGGASAKHMARNQAEQAAGLDRTIWGSK